MKKVLIIVDIQNDYFEGGAFPLWEADEVLLKIEKLIADAKQKEIPIVLIQHIADNSQEDAPFFIEGTKGVELHPRILAAAPDAKIVIKTHLDSFKETKLEETLQSLGAQELVVCGMMTQNCVTHTMLSESAKKYKIRFIPECSTTMNRMIHENAVRSLSTRVNFEDLENALVREI